MRRRTSSVGAELGPLILILACLVGSFGLIIAAYRRVNVAPATPANPPISIIAPTALVVATPPKPAPITDQVVGATPVPVAAITLAEDPTPKVLAGLTAAEAEQLLEASQANRQAQALEEARQAAVAESERWRRRQSLVHAQIKTLESKVRKVEMNLDAMALERDALERELDARKAAVASASSRPSQAILPHKGPNGTWRRPIVIECRNGAAVIQPQGLEFGLLDLESGFGPTTNRFVAAVAREGIRVQRQASPDGALVVPYIFFLVRPDGIRPYYEARGRLEPLGITFGYELADADWEIEFPNLDDVVTWDGSASPSGSNSVLGGTGSNTQRGGVPNAEDTDLPVWPGSRPGSGGSGADNAGSFTFRAGREPNMAGSRLSSRLGQPSAGASGGGTDSAAESGRDSTPGQPVDPAGVELPRLADVDESNGNGSASRRFQTLVNPSGTAGPRVAASGRLSPGNPEMGSHSEGAIPAPNRTEPNRLGVGPGSLSPPITQTNGGIRPAFELALDGPTADAHPGSFDPTATQTRPTSSAPVDSLTPPGELALSSPIINSSAPPPGIKPDLADPGTTFVWPGTGNSKNKGRPQPETTEPVLNLAARSGELLDPAGNPLAAGPPSASPLERSGTGFAGGSQAAKAMFGQLPPAGQPAQSSPPSPGAEAVGIGPSAAPLPPNPQTAPTVVAPTTVPPPGLISPSLPLPVTIPPHPPTPSEVAAAVRRQTSPNATILPSLLPDARPIVDRTFEVVVVCGPQGVIVQPGSYRITAAALQDREDLFKKQVVALVKTRRAATPQIQIEPRIRFLVQPRGFETYRAARSQFFVSGLTWPTTTEVANPDPLAITTSGVR